MASSAPIKILVYIFRRDLRLTDNPVFNEISRAFQEESCPFTHLLPVYAFSAHQIEISGLIPQAEQAAATPKSPYPEARSKVGGFWRCGPHRAKFLVESVWDLKNTLEQKDSQLVIRAGRLTDVVRDVFRHAEGLNKPSGKAPASSADVQVTGVWMTKDDGYEEKQEEDAVRKLVEESGREFRSVLDEKYYVHDDDLPFESIKDLSDVYTSFRKSVEPLRSIPRTPRPTVTVLPPFPPDFCVAPQFAPFEIPTTHADLISQLLRPISNDLELPRPPRWPLSYSTSMKQTQSAHPFQGGESKGLARIDHLITSGAMTSYKETRNGLLGPDFSTKLSAYLAIGCISARQINAEMTLFEDGEVKDKPREATDEEKTKLERWKESDGFGKGENTGTAGVRFELLWRDYFRLVQRKYGAKLFALHGLRKAEKDTWKQVGRAGGASSEEIKIMLQRFCMGRTGLGLIDASQRELFLTGYSSNRARQNTASFLAKHLNLDWRLGAEWFECMLVDYDVANNWGNWQYVSGVGNDPREGRLFNPVKQALDYDSKGEYIKAWVEELRDVDLKSTKKGADPDAYDDEKLLGLFQPWKLPAEEKERLGLNKLDFVEDPLVRIQFSIGKKPRGPPNSSKGRPPYRGGGGGGGGMAGGSGRGRGQSFGAPPNSGAASDSGPGGGGGPAIRGRGSGRSRNWRSGGPRRPGPSARHDALFGPALDDRQL